MDWLRSKIIAWLGIQFHDIGGQIRSSQIGPETVRGDQIITGTIDARALAPSDISDASLTPQQEQQVRLLIAETSATSGSLRNTFRSLRS